MLFFFSRKKKNPHDIFFTKRIENQTNPSDD